MRVNYVDDVSAAVDMDHLLSGTTYDKAPRGRAITIVCQHCSAIGRTSSPVLDTLGRSTLVKPRNKILHPVVRRHLFDAR